MVLEENGVILHFQEDFVTCLGSRNWTFSSNIKKPQTHTSELSGAGKHTLNWASAFVERCMYALDVLIALEACWHVSEYMSSLSSACTSLGVGEKHAFISSHILRSGGGDSRCQGGEKTLTQI